MIDDLRKGLVSYLTVRKGKLLTAAWVFVWAWMVVAVTLIVQGIMGW